MLRFISLIVSIIIVMGIVFTVGFLASAVIQAVTGVGHLAALCGGMLFVSLLICGFWSSIEE